MITSINRKHLIATAVIAAAFVGLPAAFAGEIDIQQDGFTFVPDEVMAQPGDTIRWHWSAGSHTVTSGINCAPDGTINEPLTADNPMVEYIIPADFEGNLPYFCIPHCGLYMDGVVTVEASSGTVHEVQQIGLTFQPADISVQPGDTVRWTWTGGGHTVTSGSDCTYDELYFDAPLNGDDAMFEWTVPDDLAGTLDYFCQPHCGIDMVGTITVDAPCIGDLDDDDTVGVGDLLVMLAAWGAGSGPADINSSGNVDVYDLLLLLAAWGPC
jgi:plastocyanin